MSGPRWQSNQATGDSVGARTRSRLPVIVSDPSATLVTRRPRLTKQAMATAIGAALLTSVVSAVAAASLTTAAGVQGVGAIRVTERVAEHGPPLGAPSDVFTSSGRRGGGRRIGPRQLSVSRTVRSRIGPDTVGRTTGRRCSRFRKWSLGAT